jgi:hypothetical protein
MNEPQPSNLETKIVEFTAHIQMYTVPPRKINEKEKAELQKLKVLIDKLTSGAFQSAKDLRTGPDTGTPHVKAGDPKFFGE